MKCRLLKLLACPDCKARLALHDAHEEQGEVESGRLQCEECGRQYPVVAFIPRFGPVENYTANFGVQWNRFGRTQLDSYTGAPLSRERFFLETGWSPEDLDGKRVLDVGCGAGRFAEVALSCGAHVVALDYSTAVDACRHNLGAHPGLDVIQGDIYQLPFTPGAFDYVYCLGVLQHTPDVERAFFSLPGQVRPGGRLAVDVYPRLLRNVFWSKYWLRPLTRQIPPPQLLRLVEALVEVLLPVSLIVGRLPLVGRRLRYAIPVANYDGIYPLTNAQLKEWAVLDTFDMLAPTHDSPQSAQTLRAWLTQAGLREIQISRPGHLVGRGVR
jgi:SAM-dependent methyltransferase